MATIRTEEALIDACKGSQIVLVEHPDTPITNKVIAALDDCWLIAKYSIGLDNVDVTACTERGIIVCHAPNFCMDEVSDHAVALVLNLSRRVKIFDQHVQQGGWHDLQLASPIRRLKTQTLGLLGFGKIARLVAAKMKPFGVRILCSDPYVSVGAAADLGVEAVDLENLLRESDFLSIHAPLTPETAQIIGEPQLRLMKPSAWIINTSRGRLIDETALAKALSEGRIAGAGLDVTENEPLLPTSPLRGMKHVILTAHHGAVSVESLRELRTTIAASIEAVCRGYWPNFVANPSVKPRRDLKPWIAFEALPERIVRNDTGEAWADRLV